MTDIESAFTGFYRNLCKFFLIFEEKNFTRPKNMIY